MIKNKIIRAIEKYAEGNPPPYDVADLIDRVANDRPMSDGQRRWIQKAVNDYGPGAPLGNTNRSRGNESRLYLACTSDEKARWVHAASGQKLSHWVRKTLNKAAKTLI